MSTLTLIPDREVRKCAAEWHGGQGSALLALATSGAILEDCAREVRLDMASLVLDTDENRRQYARLASLLAYVEACGPRGPVLGWSEVTF